MVNKELEKSKTMKPITPEISFIANLQNMKQGLKADYPDKELAKLLFHDLEFTEQLIKEHLSKLEKESGKSL